MESQRQGDSAAKVRARGRTVERENLHPLLGPTSRRVVHDVPLAVLVFSGSDLVSVNSEWTSLSGMNASDSEGEGWLTAIHPDDRADALLCMRSNLAEHETADEFRVSPITGDDRLVRVRRWQIYDVEPPVRVVTMTVIGADQGEQARVPALDGLTGLLNRASMIGKIRRELAEHSGLAGLLFVDLDQFKAVNDQLGHGIGDELLKAVCRRVEASIRSTDCVGRVGGDEIVVFCGAVASHAEVYRLAERLGAAISQPFGLDGEIVLIDASIGVAFADDSSRIAESLMAEADRARYVAKAAGGAQWAVSGELQEARSVGAVDGNDPLWTSLRALVARAEQESTRAWRNSRTHNFELSSRLGAIREGLSRASLLLRTDAGIEVVSVAPGAAGPEDRRPELLHAAIEDRLAIARAEGMIAQTTGADLAGAGDLLRAYAAERSLSVGAMATEMLAAGTVELDAARTTNREPLDQDEFHRATEEGEPIGVRIVEPMPQVDLRQLAALRLAYAQHAAAVYGCARFIGRSDAIDVTKDVFVALCRQPDWSDSSRGSLRILLVTMAHRLAMEAALGAVRIDDDRIGAAEAIEGVLIRGQALERTIACSGLSHQERSVAALVVYGRCSYKEVAGILGEPHAEVNRRLTTGLRRLRAALAPES